MHFLLKEFVMNSSSDFVLGSEIVYIPFAISIFGLVGNSLTFLTILRSEMRRNYANAYILVLCVADSLVLLNLFVRVFGELDTISFELCCAMRYLWNTPVYVSNFAIISLSLERFVAIVLPFHNLRHSRARRWKIICAWLLPTVTLGFNILYALRTTEKDAFSIHFKNTSEKIKCALDYERPYVNIVYHIPRLVFQFILTFFVVTIVNLVIVAKLRSRAALTGNAQSTEMRGTHIILAVIPLVYVVLNFPFSLKNILKFFVNNKSNFVFLEKHYLFVSISYYMFCLNFAMNFFIYSMFSPTFRAAFMHVWFGRKAVRKRSSVRTTQLGTSVRFPKFEEATASSSH